MSYQIILKADGRETLLGSPTYGTPEAATAALRAMLDAEGANEAGEFFVHLDEGQFYCRRGMIRDLATGEDHPHDSFAPTSPPPAPEVHEDLGSTAPTAGRPAVPAPLLDLPDPDVSHSGS